MMSMRGYAALISVLVIAATLAALSFSAALEGALARSGALDAEYAAEARALADSCIRFALLSYAEDARYRVPAQGVTVRLVRERVCTIDTIEATGQDLTIRTHARSGTGISAREAHATIASSSPALEEITDLIF